MTRLLLVSGLLLAAASPALAGTARFAESCEGYGRGFVWSPAFASCVRVGGEVTVDAGSSFGRTGMESRAKVGFDVRKDTGYGPVRVYVEPKAGRSMRD